MFRTTMISMASVAAGLLWLSSGFAQAPADAPSGSTGQCKDGSYTSAAHKSGACRGHKGVQTWYAGADTSSGSAPAAASAPSAAGAQSTQAAPATSPAPTGATPRSTQSAPATAPAKGSSSTPPATAAPGGGPGLVWVNKSSHVYHCPNDRWYGKTKNGAYMSEADAKAEGDRADHNKPCT